MTFKFTRRTFLHGASIGALSYMLPTEVAAITPKAASGPVTPTSVAAPSQRSVLNIGFVSGGGNEYRFIDHFLIAEQFGPVGTGWNAGQTWMQAIDSTGYPRVSIKAGDNKPFGGGISVPASFNYGAPGSNQYYVLKWKGNGEVKLSLNEGSWTYVGGKSTNATPVGSDRWRTTSGSDTYIVLSYTGPAQLFNVLIFSTDPNNTGAFLKKLQFYRLDDEADLDAGRVFRTPYKRSIVDLCPSAIRFMDWVGGNNSKLTRFETRTRPDYAAWGGGNGGSNWVVSPPYGATTGTNRYHLAAAAGTPTTMTQGEVVTCRIGTGMARSGAKAVTAITNSNPGRVTAPAHGFVNGDVVVHQFASGGMPKLNLLPCTITVIDQDNYSIGVNTTTFGSFAGTAQANQFISLNVGGRGAYPVVFPIPTTFASHFGDGYVATGDYKSFVFDKTVAAQTDGDGNYVYGVWMFNDGGSNNAHNGGVPLEICTALVNEVNAMKPRQLVHMWMNIPHLGLCSMDPDYSQQSSWGIQAVNVVLNGANGFAGLANSALLFVEYSNETWNAGGGAFSQTYYCAYRGFLRWPTSGTADYGSFVALRSVINVEDIKSSAYNSGRLKFVMAGQGTLGVSGLNAYRIDGSPFFLNDKLNVWGPTVAPMAHHDHFAFAGYFLPNEAFDTANLATYTNNWVANIGNPAAQEAVCAAYVQGIVNPNLGGGETVDRYRLALLPAYVAKMKSYNKTAVMYEGGWDRDIRPVSAAGLGTAMAPYASGVINGTNLITGVNAGYAAALAPGYFVAGYGIPPMTRVVSVAGTSIQLNQKTTATLPIAQFAAFTPQQMFLFAVKRSQAWASAMLTFFNQFGSGSAMPSDYVASDLRWGHSYPTAYGFGNTEWGDVDLLWQQTGARNRALSN